MKMKKDVAIIGGATSGLFTACLLTEQKADVRVFEASERIRPISRTLIVTDYVRKALGRLCDDIVVNKIHHFELFADGLVRSVSLKRPDLIIDHSKLTQRLAEQADNKGARILTNQIFLDFKPNGKRLNFTLYCNREGDFVEDSAEVLVGADGVFSRVAEKGGWPSQKTVILAQAVVELPEDMRPNTTRVWFIPEETPYFYWLIPYSNTHGVLGLIGNDEITTRRCLEGFLDRKGFIAEEYQVAATSLYRRWISNHKKLGNSDVYLVGDAAGHVKVSTVGGIVTGFRGAMGVAQAIFNGDPNGELKALRRELNLHHLIRRVLNRFTQDEYIKLLNLLSPAAKCTLGRFHRDETTSLLLHLFLKQPRFLLFGLRSLLSER